MLGSKYPAPYCTFVSKNVFAACHTHCWLEVRPWVKLLLVVRLWAALLALWGPRLRVAGVAGVADVAWLELLRGSIVLLLRVEWLSIRSQTV